MNERNPLFGPPGEALKARLNSYRPYDIIGGDSGLLMTTARTNVEFVTQPSDILMAATDSGTLDGVTVRFNTIAAPPVPILYFNPWRQPFYRVFVTHPALNAARLYLMAGRDVDQSQVNPSGVSPLRRLYGIGSASETQFTGAIVQNAVEEEDITALMGNWVRITSMQIQSVQRLDYRVLLFTRDTFSDSVISTSYFQAAQDFDLATEGFQLAGANQWYQSIEGLNIFYHDLDLTNELHMALQNKSAVAKLAGATGYVQVNVVYEVWG